jgi:hypothetical protein
MYELSDHRLILKLPLYIEIPKFHIQCEKVAYIIGTIRYISLSKADCHATIKWLLAQNFERNSPKWHFISPIKPQYCISFQNASRRIIAKKLYIAKQTQVP